MLADSFHVWMMSSVLFWTNLILVRTEPMWCSSPQRKCDQYWPVEVQEEYGSFLVTVKSSRALAYYTQRTFTVRNTHAKKVRQTANQSTERLWQLHSSAVRNVGSWDARNSPGVFESEVDQKLIKILKHHLQASHLFNLNLIWSSVVKLFFTRGKAAPATVIRNVSGAWMSSVSSQSTNLRSNFLPVN